MENLKESLNQEKHFECFQFSLGAVLAEEILATSPVPAFPVSIKDGYAVLGIPCILNIILYLLMQNFQRIISVNYKLYSK